MRTAGPVAQPSWAIDHARESTPDPITAVMMCALAVTTVPESTERRKKIEALIDSVIIYPPSPSSLLTETLIYIAPLPLECHHLASVIQKPTDRRNAKPTEEPHKDRCHADDIIQSTTKWEMGKNSWMNIYTHTHIYVIHIIYKMLVYYQSF